MQLTNQKTFKWIDGLIFGFSVLFLITLTNSIFLNQVGYYGALLSILLKYLFEKKNPFTRIGLEAAFIFFLIAEILSIIFSIDFSTALHNSLKRFLLIPTLYTFVVVSKDFKTAKQFVIIYLGAAIITLLYYLVRSYEHFINNLYQIQGSGPSVFQYPITSSELMTFSLLLLFAFLISKKSRIKVKILVFVLFMINLLALIATFKRTGWMGAAVGIIFIIILSRKWFLIVAMLLFGVALGVLNRNVSQIHVYELNKSHIKSLFSLNTDGRAYNIWVENDRSYVSDFMNGIVELKDSAIINKFDLPAPVVDFNKWRDSFYVASLADTRFVVLKSNSNGNMEILSEFYTSASPISYQFANNSFYILDDSSRLFIFKDPTDTNDKIVHTFDDLDRSVKILIGSNYCVVISEKKELKVYSLNNDLPGKLLINSRMKEDEELIGIVDKKLFFRSDLGLKVYSIESGELNLTDTNIEVGKILFILNKEQRLFLCNSEGRVFELVYPIGKKIEIKSSFELGFVPQSINFNDNRLYATLVKTNRLSSIFDPYYQSNYSRLAFWRAGIKIFKDYPLFGVGDIDLANLYRIYKRPYDREIQGHLHSNYFHSLTTLGIFGFIAIMFLLINILVLHWRAYKKLRGVPFASSYSLGAIGAYIAFLTAGLTEYNFGDHEVITLVWFTLAISLAFLKNVPNDKINPGSI
jgi:O-antigen ligase